MLNLKWRIWRYSHCDSTNLIIKNAANNGFGAGLVVISECQREGYGTRGRRWQSPEGGLYFSMLLKTTLPASRLAEIPKRVANVIMVTLQPFSKEKLIIKQPNDIVLKRSYDETKGVQRAEKLAGISTEIYKNFLVVGVGVNVFVDEKTRIESFEDNLVAYLSDFATEKLKDTDCMLQAILEDLNAKLEI